MKTHLLLSHLENDMNCPLCSMSGVSYDELCVHINSAHPEKQHSTQGLAHFTSSSSCYAATDADISESKEPQTPQSCSPVDSSNAAARATTSSVSGFTTDSVRPKQNCIHKRECSSPGDVAPVTLTTCSLRTTQKSARHFNADSDKNSLSTRKPNTNQCHHQERVIQNVYFYFQIPKSA